MDGTRRKSQSPLHDSATPKVTPQKPDHPSGQGVAPRSTAAAASLTTPATPLQQRQPASTGRKSIFSALAVGASPSPQEAEAARARERALLKTQITQFADALKGKEGTAGLFTEIGPSKDWNLVKNAVGKQPFKSEDLVTRPLAVAKGLNQAMIKYQPIPPEVQDELLRFEFMLGAPKSQEDQRAQNTARSEKFDAAIQKLPADQRKILETYGTIIQSVIETTPQSDRGAAAKALAHSAAATLFPAYLDKGHQETARKFLMAHMFDITPPHSQGEAVEMDSKKSPARFDVDPTSAGMGGGLGEMAEELENLEQTLGQSKLKNSPAESASTRKSPVANADKESKATPTSTPATPSQGVERYSPASDQDVLKAIDHFDAQRSQAGRTRPPEDLFLPAMTDAGLLTAAAKAHIPTKDRPAFELAIQNAGIREQVIDYNKDPNWDSATTIFHGFAAIEDGVTACELINQRLDKFVRDEVA